MTNELAPLRSLKTDGVDLDLVDLVDLVFILGLARSGLAPQFRCETGNSNDRR